MSDIAAWLSGLGLAEHIPLFAANDIDLSVLPDLGDDDLKELGLSLGHRRKLLRGAAALGQAEAVEDAGRRQLTVMFADLAGSTALSTKLDPEDFREVILAYQRAGTEAVRTYGGFLAKYMGDGILVYFGYPKAREDDAERAVRAGLDILAAVGRLTTLSGFVPQVRIGIATGPVVVGDLIGEGLAQERAVLGEAPNLAARLQSLAQPGRLLIAAATRRLLGNLFTLADLGQHALKGFDEPVQAWSVTGVALVASRFEATRSAGLAGFVGRADTLATLLALKDKAWRGEGQMVVLSGEAGIGKSRLAAWLAERVVDDAPHRLKYQCSAYHRFSALYPLSQQLRVAGRIDPFEPAERQLDQLERHLGLPADEADKVVPLFASLLSIPTGRRYPSLELDATEQRRLLLAALGVRFARLGRRNKLLILLEDLHWADSTTHEMLDRAVSGLPQLPALLIVTTRPGETLPWLDQPHVTLITLDRVSAEEAEEMVRFLTGAQALPPGLVRQIVAKSDGVPLYIEELTRSVLESGQLVRDDAGWRLAGSLVELQIPATLQDLLMARLDRIEGVGHIAQVAAAIGRVFTAKIIAAVSGLDQDLVTAALDKLVAADLIRRSGANGQTYYSFRHALIQDAAYESLLRGKRQALHARIVEVIEREFPELARLEEDVLAQHCSRAKQVRKAVDYWLKAAWRSLRRSNPAETATRIEAALAQLFLLPEGVERDMLELVCQSMLARVLITAKGYRFAKANEAWQRAQALVEAIGTVEQRFMVNYACWFDHGQQGQVAAAQALAERCLAEATASGDRFQLCAAEHMTGIGCLDSGDPIAAIRHFDRSAAHYDQGRQTRLVGELGADQLIIVQLSKAWALWQSGAPGLAQQALDQASEHAAAVDHRFSRAFYLASASILAIFARESEATLAAAGTELMTLGRQHGAFAWGCLGRATLGWVHARAGGGRAAIDEIAAAQAILAQYGNVAHNGMLLAFLGEAEAAAGDAKAGLATIAAGIAEGEALGLGFWLPELYRLQGVIRLRSGLDLDSAEVALERAVLIARKQQALSWELRAALDLAVVRAERGERAAAHQLIAGLLQRFEAGVETGDLRTARALLGRLAARDPVM
jgi:predicted ATPase/class 3 adenylate cyclase